VVANYYQSQTIASSTARSVQIRLKSTNELVAHNSYYEPGAEYTVTISDTSGYYVLEVTTDDFAGLSSNSCGSTAG